MTTVKPWLRLKLNWLRWSEDQLFWSLWNLVVLFCFWIEASTNNRFELYSKATVTWIELVQVIGWSCLLLLISFILS